MASRLGMIAGFLMCLVSPAGLAMNNAELQSLLDQALAQQDLPGLRAAVQMPDGRIVSAATGFSNTETRTPLDNTIGMPGGSTGKTFVATVTMLLVEDGLLALDDPISRWVGEHDWYAAIPDAGDIRVAHLLAHTSGMADYPGSLGFIGRMLWRNVRGGSAYFPPEELIGIASKRDARFAPGKGFAYTDAGYLVLGRVIEAASGMSYEQLLRHQILEPHRLDGVRLQNEAVLKNIATGYQGGVANLKPDGRMKLDPRTEWTGGGLILTPTDLVTFYGLLAGGKIVNESSFDQMRQAGWQNPSAPDHRYGYGLFIDDNRQTLGHGGKWVGYRTHVTHYLASGITIAVQTNTDDRVDLPGVIATIAAAVAAETKPPPSRQ